jgi:hypothetical protein
MPDEAAASYQELFGNPDNEWNAEFGEDGSSGAAGEGGTGDDGGGGGGSSYLGDLDAEGTRGLIDGDGFDSGDIDDWRTRCSPSTPLHVLRHCG